MNRLARIANQSKNILNRKITTSSSTPQCESLRLRNQPLFWFCMGTVFGTTITAYAYKAKDIKM